MRAVMREVLSSRQFWDERNRYTRYAWPVEFTIRAIKDVGWRGLSLNDARVALGNMGQILFDPPDVAGWESGQSWFSTGAMLSRMNFASTLAGNQKFELSPGGGRPCVDAPRAPGVGPRLAQDGAPFARSDDGSPRLPARDRPLDRQPDANSEQGRRSSFTSWPERRSTSSYEDHQTAIRQGWRGGVHDDLCRAGVPERPRARAGRIRSQPDRPVPERRQRRAEHARALQRSVLLLAPAAASRCRPATCCRSERTRPGSRSGSIRA